MMNIDALTGKIADIVASHALGGGEYARWLWQDGKGTRELGNNEYGCADAANILYTIGQFPTGQAREDMLAALLALQDPATGLFEERTHHTIHTTAHCTAAIELFDARPLYPLTALKKYQTVEGLYGLLESLNWTGNPWPQSHQGAGIYAASVLCGEVSLAWQNAYFDWLWAHTDPKYGMSCAGTVDGGTASLSAHMCGWFHYTFNMEYARRPMRYPARVIDSNLEMYNTHTLSDNERGKHAPADVFGRTVGFREIDWVFCVSRAMRQTPHRFEEARAALTDFARSYIPWLESLDPQKDEGLNDLHMLFGAVCAVAELQRALPGEIVSQVPWKLVLDRRPFI